MVATCVYVYSIKGRRNVYRVASPPHARTEDRRPSGTHLRDTFEAVAAQCVRLESISPHIFHIFYSNFAIKSIATIGVCSHSSLTHSLFFLHEFKKKQSQMFHGACVRV